MIITAYRGIEYQEAVEVVERQQYKRDERRSFVGGLGAKAVFGSGVYLVSNPQVAADYAFCHAEISWGQAAILEQQLHFSRPRVLHSAFGENELRDEAIHWKYSREEMVTVASILRQKDWLRWSGEQIREYLLERGFDGIVYHIQQDLTYYVSYEPAKQLQDIRLVSSFCVPSE